MVAIEAAIDVQSRSTMESDEKKSEKAHRNDHQSRLVLSRNYTDDEPVIVTVCVQDFAELYREIAK